MDKDELYFASGNKSKGPLTDPFILFMKGISVIVSRKDETNVIRYSTRLHWFLGYFTYMLALFISESQERQVQMHEPARLLFVHHIEELGNAHFYFSTGRVHKPFRWHLVRYLQ
jgi:hypothetical protein